MLRPGDAVFVPAWWTSAVHASAAKTPAPSCGQGIVNGTGFGEEQEGGPVSDGGGDGEKSGGGGCLSIGLSWEWESGLEWAEARPKAAWGRAEGDGGGARRGEL